MSDQPNPPSPLAAVLLAAGMSRRMGQPKALLDLGGKPLILHVVQTLQRAGPRDPHMHVLVVTGHRPERIHQALDGTRVEFVHNPHYEAGQMLSSVKAGAAAVFGRCEAFFLMLLDQPLVQESTLQALYRTWIANRAPITVPSLRGRRGHPILISAAYIPEILEIPETGSLRDLIERYRSQTELVEVNDPGITTDLDTPEDYQRILAMGRSTQP